MDKHIEQNQMRARFGEQLRSSRARLYGADDMMTEKIVRIEALLSTLAAYDWSADVRRDAAEICGVATDSTAACAVIASAAYRAT